MIERLSMKDVRNRIERVNFLVNPKWYDKAWKLGLPTSKKLTKKQYAHALLEPGGWNDATKKVNRGFGYTAYSPGDRHGTRFELVWYDGNGSYTSRQFNACGIANFCEQLSTFALGMQFQRFGRKANCGGR